MPNEEVLKCTSGGITCEVSELVNELIKSLIREYLGNDVAEFTAGLGRFMLCRGEFSEAYLIPKELEGLVTKLLRSGRVPYSVGMYLGRVRSRKPRFVPSVNLLHITYCELGVRSALVVSLKGLKPFLYGNDVLKESVINCFEPVRRGYVVGIVGEDGYVYGVGLPVINSCSELNLLKGSDVVALNVFDVGWFLRGGTVPRERMFKV